MPTSLQICNAPDCIDHDRLSSRRDLNLNVDFLELEKIVELAVYFATLVISACSRATPASPVRISAS